MKILVYSLYDIIDLKYREERISTFLKKVEVNSEDECWPWLGRKNTGRDFGVFPLYGRWRIAPRLAWEISNGRSVPNGMCICHSCDNPICVNPKHLWAGTHKDNMNDRERKKRNKLPSHNNRGSNNGMSKLKEEDIIRMRFLFDTGIKKPFELAKEYNIAWSAAANIVKRKSWRHIK